MPFNRGILILFNIEDVAMAVGRVRVKHVWVLRAVIAELLESKELQARVIERVREDNSK